ncbi:hypothetical protein TBR22_A12220 [Luteitalea sp. TBR-22]|nr:hypothetical protein TBR22_A12220 [Luteitalea sp. TBR-22]
MTGTWLVPGCVASSRVSNPAECPRAQRAPPRIRSLSAERAAPRPSCARAARARGLRETLSAAGSVIGEGAAVRFRTAKRDSQVTRRGVAPLSTRIRTSQLDRSAWAGVCAVVCLSGGRLKASFRRVKVAPVGCFHAMAGGRLVRAPSRQQDWCAIEGGV